MDESLVKLNKGTLAGELYQMKEQMKKVKQEEHKRNWTNEGLNHLGDLLRKHSDLQSLSDMVLATLTKYVSANQGALFVVNQGQNNQDCLELTAAYAYDRKKYASKQIAPGEGLAGQAWQEGETVYVSDVPRDYVRITSGLGDATPTNLLIVPLKHDQQVQGVLELASFARFESHTIAFVEKTAENIALTFAAAKTAERTEHLLRETRQMTESLRSQEEEMRQNMEELIATQEELQRKEQQYLRRIAQLESATTV